MHTATYSPDDNKLRLYPASRLSAEEYQRVKAAGFKWAPKQELFVAPMWTPARAALLVDMCGDIGDEDTSLVERTEERAERFGDYSEARANDARAAHAAVSAIADHIPLGQPILVGHHSEKRARRDAEKIEHGMRRAVKAWDTSQYWKQRAAGAIRAAKYKELPSVRARRIKKIEADRRKMEKRQKYWSGALKWWSRPSLTREQAVILANNLQAGGVILPDGSSYYCAWSALTKELITLEDCKAQMCAKAEVEIAACQPWLDHYDFRLEYERAMLGESGGTVADRTKPEKGGAVRSWAGPGFGRGWSYIQKVNRVSVSLLDSFSDEGRTFTRTIAFDKLQGVMSAAEVEALRAAGRIAETKNKAGFFVRDVPPDAPAVDGSDALPVVPMREKPAEFEAMREALKSGVAVVSAFQLFPTPAGLAARVVELARIPAGADVLEPSAGTGALIRAITSAQPSARVYAVECNYELSRRLEGLSGLVGSRCSDFLEVGPSQIGQFDCVVMNPPFADAADVKHIKHAVSFLKPGGRLVAICANGPRQRERLEPIASEWIELEPGAFAESGTNVRAAIVIIEAEPAEAAEPPAPKALTVAYPDPVGGQWRLF